VYSTMEVAIIAKDHLSSEKLCSYMLSPISPLMPYICTCSNARSFTLLCSSIVLRFLLLALLNTKFYYWDYYTIPSESSLGGVESAG